MSERTTRTGGRDHGEYVRRLQEASQKHARDVLAENERLRLRVARLEAESERLCRAARFAEGVLATEPARRAAALSLERECGLLREQVLTLGERIEAQERDYAALEARLARAEGESRRAREDYAEVEHRNASLASLYVASYQLHGSLQRAQVLTAIHEIVADLVGSEETAVFELDASGTHLVLLAAHGVETDRYRSVPVDGGLLGRPVRTGEVFLAERDGRAGARPDEARLTAAVPLTLEGRVTGVLAVFGLLPQKDGLGPLDAELFDLLSAQAAIALHCARLHARVEGAATP